jgi:hypothetical protein
MNFFNFLKDEKEDLQFIDASENSSVYPHFPPVLAKNVTPFFKETQEKQFGGYQFPGCPGMYDYSKYGYIVPAWTDIHIKSNKAGNVAISGSRGEDFMRRVPPVKQPMRMDLKQTHGLFKFQDNIEPCVWNIPGPWHIIGSKNVSALLMPAIYHCDFFDDLYVYPGIVDYENFHTINFICSAKRNCEVHIKAGTPLIHVIPFHTTKTIVASYGPATSEQISSMGIRKEYWIKNFYRKFCMIRKRFKIFKKVSE